MPRSLLAWCLFAAVWSAPSALAHAPDSGSAPLEGTRVRLQNLTAQYVIALFSRAALPDAAHTPRAARAETPESLLPEGVDAILRGEGGEVTLVGAQAKCQALADLLRRLDGEVTPATAGEVETRVRSGASAREVAGEIRALPGGGAVKVEGSELRLTGTREWLFRALRVVIRTETQSGRAKANRSEGGLG